MLRRVLRRKIVTDKGVKNPLTLLMAIAFGLMAFSFSGCGRQGFRKATLEFHQTAPGHFEIPAKVDIVLAMDDSASMTQAFTEVSSQLPKFLSDLEAKNWDYHFITTPLGTTRSIDEILVSKYDGNWASLGKWKSPYPGANPALLSIPNFLFTAAEPSAYGGFLTLDDIRQDGKEAGIDTIFTTLDVEAAGTGFMRPDAMTVVLIISTGNDDSGVRYCKRQDQSIVPCGADTSHYNAMGDPYCIWEDGSSHAGGCEVYDTRTSSYSSLKTDLESFVALGDTTNLRVYSAVPTANRANCRDYGYVKSGSRYQNLASSFGGVTYPLCSTPISEVLSGMSNHLKNIKLGFRMRYLVMAEEPDVSTIEVTRNRNGNTETIPQSDSNGWSYVGYMDGVAAIEYPTPMNYVSGYLIRLNGDAVLVGDDSADVQYKPLAGEDEAS